MMNSSDTCKAYKKRMVVLVGIHGSGKTTLGLKLKADGFDYYPEIGTELRKRTEKSVCESQDEFDRLVLKLESERDLSLIIKSAFPVVETWHIGNYAFALTRNSSIKDYEHVLEEKLKIFYPLVVRFLIDDYTFLERNTENNIQPQAALHFYRELERNLLLCIDDLYKKRLVEINTYIGDNYEALKNELWNFMSTTENNYGVK